ncbi:ankyrin repeat domain-containing protein [Paenibacillus glycinis]|uniref:Ankyrin repeat domain-containing protein n=1 Tax=Paenibacillus glycinis TaxID=2697035 RepID=A0ABW9XQ34_9BACL|nr:ankyrin repeat domain-containing protein [Paenibacillus glycinis]NBD24751.1 hypothetical protein [Paenibacillus glycinis]
MDAEQRKAFDSLSDPDKETAAQLTQAISQGDADTAARLFGTHPWLSALIDVPCFAFDSPAIVAAASRGDRAMVDVLLAHGADINAKSQWWAGGFGVLHHDHHALSRYLIGRGADVDAHAAAALGMIETLERLAEEDPAVVNRRGPDGQVPLHFAKDRQVVDFLLSRGAEIDMRDLDHGSTPAQWAVHDKEICGYLVERGAAPDIFMACMLNDAAMLRRILEADPNAVHAQVGKGAFTSGDSDGGHIYVYKVGPFARPLILALRLHYRELVDAMLAHSSPEQRLLLACYEADANAVRAITDAHGNLVASLKPEDEALLVDAAGDHRLDAVRTMLDAGFRVDARRSPRSSTALHASASRGDLDIVRFLLARGASVHAENEFGATPLRSCIWGSLNLQDPAGDYAGAATMLIEAGAKLPDRAAGSDSVRQLLLAHGAAG